MCRRALLRQPESSRPRRFARGAGCEHADVCSASTALSQMDIGPWSARKRRSTEVFPAERRTEDLERISGAAAGASGAAFPDIPAAADSIGHVQRQHSRLGGGAQVQDVTRRVPQSRQTRATQSDPQEHREHT